MSVKDYIEKAISGLQHNVNNPTLSVDTKNEISLVINSLEYSREKIVNLEKYINIDSKLLQSVEDSPLRKYYESLDNGVISIDEKIDQFIRVSPLLNNLYKRGLTFRNLYKFSKTQKKYSHVIGDNIEHLSGVLRGIRLREISNSDPDTLLAQCHRNDKGLGILERNFSDKSLLDIKRIIISENGKKLKFNSAYHKNTKDNTNSLIFFKFSDKRIVTFLDGDWLTCFVYDIIEDQLKRESNVYEVYSKIKYSAPREILSHASDFDVLGSIGDKIFAVECKSGRFDQERGDLDEVLRKYTELKAALYSVYGEEMKFFPFLVYDPYINKKAMLEDFFGSTDMITAAPSEVRGKIAERLARG